MGEFLTIFKSNFMTSIKIEDKINSTYFNKKMKKYFILSLKSVKS